MSEQDELKPSLPKRLVRVFVPAVGAAAIAFGVKSHFDNLAYSPDTTQDPSTTAAAASKDFAIPNRKENVQDTTQGFVDNFSGAVILTDKDNHLQMIVNDPLSTETATNRNLMSPIKTEVIREALVNGKPSAPWGLIVRDNKGGEILLELKQVNGIALEPVTKNPHNGTDPGSLKIEDLNAIYDQLSESVIVTNANTGIVQRIVSLKSPSDVTRDRAEVLRVAIGGKGKPDAPFGIKITDYQGHDKLQISDLKILEGFRVLS